MTTIGDIERRLRMAAPDEPRTLPPLRFPADRVGRRFAPGVRFRPSAVDARGTSLVYAVVLLLLLLLAVIIAGAVRLLDNPFDPTAGRCPALQEAGCYSIEVPDGWHTVASGSLFPGDFTAEGIGYERVELVIANVELSSCPNASHSIPTPLSTNGVIYLPRETADPDLLCIRSATLPAGGIRLEVVRGDRILGVGGPDGPSIPDTTEPTSENGWSLTVADRPARLTVLSQGATETRTWDVLFPASIDRILRIRADIAGPDLEAGRAAVAAVVDSIAFADAQPELREGDGAGVLTAFLDEADRARQQDRSDFFACFSREPGSVVGTISGGFGGPLGGTFDVTCTSSISRSAAGVWRIRLDVTWDAAAEFEAGGLRYEAFTARASVGQDVGYFISLDDRPMPPEGVDGWLPHSTALPALLDGPLNLPTGVVVEVLRPGQYPLPEPDGADDTIAPMVVGLHFYVIGGPRIVDGDEWYQVQWDQGASPAIAWARGTRDGRPLLAVVEPTCPPEPTVRDLAWLTSAERLLCLGHRELALPGILVPEAAQTPRCAGADSEPTACPPQVGDPQWLTALSTWWLYGEGGPSSAAPGLMVWFAPTVGVPSNDQLLDVRGHFDDAAAAGCTLPAAPGEPSAESPVVQELTCRERFVITSFSVAQ